MQEKSTMSRLVCHHTHCKDKVLILATTAITILFQRNVQFLNAYLVIRTSDRTSTACCRCNVPPARSCGIALPHLLRHLTVVDDKERDAVGDVADRRRDARHREGGKRESLMHPLGGILDIDHRGQSYIRGARRACDGDRVDEEASAMRRRLAVASFRRPKVACSGRVLA